MMNPRFVADLALIISADPKLMLMLYCMVGLAGKTGQDWSENLFQRIGLKI